MVTGPFLICRTVQIKTFIPLTKIKTETLKKQNKNNKPKKQTNKQTTQKKKMQFSTTMLTLFLTALASLSTTQARIGQTPFPDNRMLEEEATAGDGPTPPLVKDITGTWWADHSDTGGCAMPVFNGMQYLDDGIAVGDEAALLTLKIKTDDDKRMCGQVYDITCVNHDGVQGPTVSAVIASTCNVGKGNCGIDMVDETWDKATNNAIHGIATCTAELNKSSMFKDHDDMVCTFAALNGGCGDCQTNLYYTQVGLFNTKGKIVVSAKADGNEMTHNDEYNQFYEGASGKGAYNNKSEFVFTFEDGTTHSCLYGDLQRPQDVNIW